MRPRRLRRVAWLALAVVVAGGVAMAALRDALLPWLPVKAGYAAHATRQGVVYHPRGTPLPDGLPALDSVMDAVARHHGIGFRRPVAVVVSPTWRAFNRGRLSLDGDRAVPVLGAALQTGTVVYLSPLATTPGRTPATTLAHELSHALLYQHVSLPRSFALREHRWLLEGLAASAGNPGDHLDAATFGRLARAGYPVTLDPAPAGIVPDSLAGAFALATYRHFVDHLRGRHGAATMTRFLGRLLRDPSRLDEAFRATYGAEPSAAADAFAACVRSATCAGASP